MTLDRRIVSLQRSSVFLVVVLLAMSVLSGCVSRPADSLRIRGITPTEAVNLDTGSSAGQPAFTARKGDVHILALSGGGTDGAYGVGVLNGWSEAGTRPQFDIVTGVSTGALMSVFAFLGEKYDKPLMDMYLSSKKSDLFRSKGIQGFLSDSIYDNTPLKQQIERFVTPRVVAEIATAHRAGRRLYVATTNLDANELVVWDIGLLANGGGDGRANNVQLIQKVLRASAAIPVLLPPVYIKPKRGVQLRQAHVDGGVRAPVLVSDFLFRVPAKKRRLYVIINGSLAEEDTHQPVKPRLDDIAATSVNGLTRELTQQMVYRAYIRAGNSGTDYNLTAIPEDIPPQAESLAFDHDYLRRLFERGRRDVKRPGFWWKEPPTLREFDRLAKR